MSTSYSKSNIFMAAKDSPVAPWKRALNYFVVVVAVVAVVGVSLSVAGIALNFDFVVQYRARIWDGFCLTVFISLFSLVGSLVIGIPVALGQNARFLPVRYLCDFYVKIIRGTPLIAQIYSVLLHHRYGMGCRESRSCRHPHSFGVRWRLYCRDHPRRI